MVLGAALVFACGATEKPGGSRAEAGAGSGGSPTNGQFEPCAIEDLAQHCASSSCPESPDDVVPFCANDDFRGTTRSATECGGTLVSINYGLGYTDFYFDQDGALVGIVSLSDVGRECSDGHSTLVTQFGETCAAVGEPEDVCEGAPGCNQTEVCGDTGVAFYPCPGDLADFEANCSYARRVERYDSTCGGTIVIADANERVERFTFDQEGKLVGTDANGEMGRHQCWGKPCAPEGPAEVLCTNAGGAPATDAGGAGGSDSGGAGSVDAGGAGGSP